MNKRKLLILTAIFVFSFFAVSSVYAFEIKFGPEDTKLNGFIKYSVIGRYKCAFEEFEGKILLNEEKNGIESVNLAIEAATISSNCGWCDKIVRSKQLLHVEKYPQITFSGSEIVKGNEGYMVKGTLDMHGVSKEIIFPFNASFYVDEASQERMLEISGTWKINRKDFGIIWNRLLDKGGVLVGNYMTVDWGINTKIDQPKG